MVTRALACRFPAVVVAGILALAAGAASGAGQLIDDVRVVRSGHDATVTLELACPMRLQSHVAVAAGAAVEVRLAPLDTCRELGLAAAIASEIHRPPSGRLAYLTEIQYDALGVGEHLLALQFERPVEYRLTQRGDRRRLTLIVRLDAQPSGLPAAAAMPASPPVSEIATDRTGSAAAGASGRTRAPLVQRVREPAVTADFVVNLVSTRELAEARAAAVTATPGGARLYISSIVVDGTQWHRLRLGFFASEAEARAALEPLAARYPRAWIGRAEPDEVRSAEGAALLGLTADAGVADAPEQPAVPAPAAAARPADTPRGEADLAALQAAGRDAFLRQDYAAAIGAYTALLRSPGEHRAEARERLALAYERSGDLAQASAEYRVYLEQHGEGEGARRVRQRLNGLTAAVAPPPTPLRQAAAAKSRWQFESGVSQYYRRDAQQLEGQPEVVGLSALFSDFDLRVRRSGDAVDLESRVTVSHLYDLERDGSRASIDQSRVSYAFFDIDDAGGDWALRVGRQRMSGAGVLGRFDGAHFSHALGDGRRVHVTTGYPVDSTRDGIETERRFVGTAFDFDELIGAWSLTAFATQQTIGGIDDRRAVGVETRYFDARRSVTAMLDYDAGFGELNTALAFATWRLENRMTVTGLVDVRLSPVLSTRNALIGQTATTVEELLLEWREEELEQLARDRTAQSRTVTLGVATPLAERLQLNVDVTVTELEPISGAAAGPLVPATGQQVYYSTTLIASALFGTGDVSIFNLRHGSADDFTSSQLTWDARFPLGRRVRLNPRLRLTVWEHVDGRKRETVSPSLRLLVNAGRHRLELEAGTSEMLRTDPRGEQRATGEFLNVGYRTDF